MSESLGPRKKDWDFSSTLKTLLDRHTLELSNEELEEINLYLLNQREHAIALYTEQNTDSKRCRPQIQTLKKEDLRQMLFLHAENLEQTELFFSSFCQKTVAVNQKNHREQANDIGSHPHHCQDRIFSDHGIKATSLRQCIHDKKHHHRADA